MDLQAFLQRFLFAIDKATRTEYAMLEGLARYILELSLLDYTMLAWRPSTVAASAVLLARAILMHIMSESLRPGMQCAHHCAWTATQEHYCFHTVDELQECTCKLHRALLAASQARHGKTSAVHCKYAAQRKRCISTLPVPEHLPAQIFERYAFFPVPANEVVKGC